MSSSFLVSISAIQLPASWILGLYDTYLCSSMTQHHACHLVRFQSISLAWDRYLGSRNCFEPLGTNKLALIGEILSLSFRWFWGRLAGERGASGEGFLSEKWVWVWWQWWLEGQESTGRCKGCCGEQKSWCAQLCNSSEHAEGWARTDKRQPSPAWPAQAVSSQYWGPPALLLQCPHLACFHRNAIVTECGSLKDRVGFVLSHSNLWNSFFNKTFCSLNKSLSSKHISSGDFWVGTFVSSCGLLVSSEVKWGYINT